MVDAQPHAVLKIEPVQDADFSDAFCRFLQATIPAVDAAELLIWFSQHPEGAADAGRILQDIGAGSGLSEADAARYLEAFRSAGLLASPDGRQYRYAPGAGLEEHVRVLATAYRERPVTLIRVIYALRDKKIQTFADAFRLRRKD